MNTEMHEEMAMKKIDAMRVMKEDGELDVDKTRSKLQSHKKMMQEQLDEEKLDSEIAATRYRLFKEDPRVLNHSATFAFEVESTEWKELSAKKLLRSFERNKNECELVVERIEYFLKVLDRELEAL